MKFYYEIKGYRGIIRAKDDEAAEANIVKRHGKDEARDIYVLREASENDLESIKL